MNTSVGAAAFLNRATPDSFERRGAPTHLIDVERAKPATCFTISTQGVLEEGISLDFDHSLSGGNIALIVGENSFVARDRFGNRGCLYEVKNGRALVRRASLGFFETQGGKVIPLLRKLEGAHNALLVYVNYGMPENVRLKPGFEVLDADILGTACKVAQNGTEALVEIKQGETFCIYYPDGRVILTSYEELTNGRISCLGNELALNARLEVVRGMLSRAASMEDADRAAKSEDWALHQLAAMLRMAFASPKLYAKVVGEIDHYYAEDGVIRPGVRQHLINVLIELKDPVIHAWAAHEIVEARSAVSEVPTLLNPKKYDGRLHGLISEAIEFGGEWKWQLAFGELKKASEEGQLRPGVQKRFCTQCPAVFSELSDEAAKLPLAEAAPQGRKSLKPVKKTQSREERMAYEKRRDANRAKRLENRPVGRNEGQSNGKKNGKK